MQDIVSRLPPELSLRIIQYLPLPTLSSFEAVCSSWRCLVDAHEDQIFPQLIVGRGMSRDGKGRESLNEMCSRLNDECYGRTTWEGVRSWRALCHTQANLDRNMSDPDMCRSRIFLSDLTCTRPADLAIDLRNRLLLVRHTSACIEVYDLDTTAELFTINHVTWTSVLNYDADAGIVVFDGWDGLEIWKLERCPPEQDPSTFSRGRFYIWGQILHPPFLYKFHLKHGILTTVNPDNTTMIYDVVTSPTGPVLIQTLHHSQHDIVHLDRTPTTFVVCHGHQVRCYCTLTGSLLGMFPPPRNIALAHYTIRQPAVQRRSIELSASEVVYDGMMKPFDIEDIRPAGSTSERTRWKACCVDGPYLVLLSDRSDLFVCTDYEAVLGAAEGEERKKVMETTCCYFIMEVHPRFVACGSRYRPQPDSLSICNGRVSFGTLGYLMILPLPPAQTVMYTKLPQALSLPAKLSLGTPRAILMPDGLLTIWGILRQPSDDYAPKAKFAIRLLWFDGRIQSMTDEDSKLAFRLSNVSV